MKILHLIIGFLFCSSLISQKSSLRDVMNKYLQMEELVVKVQQITKKDIITKADTYNYYVKQNRMHIKRLYGYNDIEMVYYNPGYAVTQKTKNEILFFGNNSLVADTFEYDIEAESECYQILGTNIGSFFNPFTNCFYHPIKILNNAKLEERQNVFFYKMEQNISGLPKHIWINKSTLLVDSLKYWASGMVGKVYFTYYSYKTKLDSFTIKPLPNSVSSLNYIDLSLKLRGTTIKNPIKVDKPQFNTLYKSKYFLIDFWYLGCAPCLQSFPYLQKIDDCFSDSTIKIIAVSPHDNDIDIRNYKNMKDYSFVMCRDTLQATKYYKVEVFPTKLLIDRKGEVLLKLYGHKKNDLDAIIEGIKNNETKN